jgi:hypothetical protein
MSVIAKATSNAATAPSSSLASVTFHERTSLSLSRGQRFEAASSIAVDQIAARPTIACGVVLSTSM